MNGKEASAADAEAAKTLSWANMVRKAQGLRPLGGLLAAGGLAAMSFFGRSRGTSDSAAISNPLVDLYQYPDPPLPSIDEYGGAKDNLLPALTSASNRENRDGPVPRVYGKRVKFFPPIAAHPFPTVVGPTQTISGVLECGPGPLKLEGLEVSDRPLSEFPTIQVGYQYGKSDDSPLSFYTTDVENVQVNERLISSPHEKTKRCGQEGTRIGYNILFPNGLYALNAQGQVVSASVAFYVFARNLATGLYEHYDYPVATASQTSPFFLYREFSVPEGLYDVSIQRQVISPESTSPNLVNESHWTDLVCWTNGKPFLDIKNSVGQLVRMARIEYRATATADLNGSLGQISVLATSQLPIWNGTTWSAPVDCNNPAWIICAMLRGPENYRPVSDDQIDLIRMKEFAEWCDLKGYTYDAVMEGMDLETACREVAAAGRAHFFERNGQYSVAIDKPQDTVVQLFTPRNILEGSFSMEGHYIDPPDYLEVSFVNPDVGWLQDKREVYDEGKTKDVDFKVDTLSLKGVKNKDIVHHLAKYFMANNRLRTETYQFSTDIEQIRCEFWDRIKVEHDRLGIGLGRGRITSLALDGSNNITGISIDAAQVMESGKSYDVTIRTSAGGFLVLEVVAIAGQTKSFTFVTPIDHTATDKPLVGDLVAFGLKGFSSRDLLVLSIEPQADLSAQFTCVDYIGDAIYNADSGTVPAYTPMVTRPRNLDITVPTPTVYGAQSNEAVLDRSGDGSLRTRILVTVGAVVPQVTQLEWQYRRVGQTTWSPSTFFAPSSTSGSFSVYDVQERESYDIQVRCRIGNYFGPWNTTIQNHYVIGKTTPPPPVPNIIEREPNSTFMKWFYDSEHTVVVPKDFDGFRIKFAWGAYANWNQGYTLINLTSSTRFDFGGLARGVKTIMIKAVDVAGNEQTEEPAILQLDFGDVDESNIIVSLPHEPLFDRGVKTACSVSASKLVSDDNGSLFWGDDLAPFWGSDLNIFWNVQYIEGSYVWSYTPAPSERKPFNIMEKVSITGPYRLEYRTFGNTLMWGPDGDSFWGLDAELFWEFVDPPYQPVPDQGIEGDWISYQFRLTLLPGPEQVQVTTLQDRIDVPDIIEYVNDFIVTSTGGSRPGLTNGYRAITSVNITPQITVVNPNIRGGVTLDKLATGPLIQALDGSGSPTTGMVDLIIRGY